MNPPPSPIERLRSLYPALCELPAVELDALQVQVARALELPAGAGLFEEGDRCQGFPMVLDGAIRVARAHAVGVAWELYRLLPGDICVVSTAGLFQGRPLSANAETLAPTRLVVVAAATFERWCEVPAFRRQVFGTFAARMADLMSLAEAVAFQRLDQRLAHALLRHGSSLQTTHQALADELGTVREIVSRLLNRFERQGWVELARERIELRDLPALRALAAGDDPAPA